MADIRYIDYAGNVLPGSATPTVTYTGTSASETLTGTDANEMFRGIDLNRDNSGVDTMIGGGGDDSYNVTNTAFKLVELPGGGTDTVRTVVNFVLPENVENLTIAGYTGYSGTTGIGNSGANVMIGDQLKQIFDGRAGNDVLTGGGGGDVFVFQANSGHDVITDFFAGTKPAMVSIKDYDVKSFADVQSRMTQVGNDVVLKLSDTDDITFRNATVDKFTADNFTTPLDKTGMTLRFSDEFNGSNVDLFNAATGTGKWLTYYGWGGDTDAKMSRTLAESNGERQMYVEAGYRGTSSTDLGLNPFAVHDGVLDITATQTPAELRDSLYGLPYTSGLLTTKASFTQTYGYYEISAKLPSAQGAWPAFWLFGSSAAAPSEIDIMEASGGSPGIIKSVAHDASIPRNSNIGSYYIEDADKTFHTYGVKWDAEHLTYYVDGRQVHQSDTPANMHRPMYMLVNLAVGASGGIPDPSKFPATMTVDYIRAYSLSDADALATDSTLPNQTGTDGNDVMTSSVATLTMSGGLGDDTYYVNHQNAVVAENPNGGIDTVKTTLSTYTLTANVENLTYVGTDAFIGTGNELNNTIIGGPDADRLNGGAGDDILIGGKGNDVYFVDSRNDQVIEAANEGFDTLYASVSYKLGAGQEVELMVAAGDKPIDLTGNELGNVIVGNNANNRIDGGAGGDKMEGRGGNDIYYVDHVSDQVIERVNDGFDAVMTTLNSYYLPKNVEVLTFTGTGDFVGVGNGLANVITGGAGNDRLDGGGGTDVLIGGAGDDGYWITNVGVTVVEKPGEGFDTMSVLVNTYKAAPNVEQLIFRGTGDFTGYASVTGTQIVGGAGNDGLNGDIGNDILIGNGGMNRLRGGAGNDLFAFSAPGAGTQRIVDFTVGEDHLAIDHTLYGISSLDDVNFLLSPSDTASKPGASFIYDASGKLYYSASGVMDDKSVLLATLDYAPTLHVSDFVMT